MSMILDLWETKVFRACSHICMSSWSTVMRRSSNVGNRSFGPPPTAKKSQTQNLLVEPEGFGGRGSRWTRSMRPTALVGRFINRYTLGAVWASLSVQSKLTPGTICKLLGAIYKYMDRKRPTQTYIQWSPHHGPHPQSKSEWHSSVFSTFSHTSSSWFPVCYLQSPMKQTEVWSSHF